MATTVKETRPAETLAHPVIMEPASRGFWETMSNALIITRREIRDSVRDWRIVAPLILLTVFFPFLAQDVAGRFSEYLKGFGAELIGERTIPFLLMVVGFFPISISLVIALETFVGEKERRSLEPLLSTPLTNTELYIGKTLSAMIPPVVASLFGMTFYMTILLQNSTLEWRPQPMLIVQIVLLTVVQALVMVTGAVVVSSQTTSTRAANLLASFIIIPMTLIINGESIIMFLAPDAESPTGIGALWAIIIGMGVAVVLLLRVGNSIFNREELLGRTIDSINLRSMARRIWLWTRAADESGQPARDLLDWYRRAIPYSLSKLKTPLVITILTFLVAFSAGFLFGNLPEWRLPLPGESASPWNASAMMDSMLNTSEYGGQGFFFMIVMQNGRVLLAAALLALFTFGVGALVLTPVTYAILGYLLSQILLAGIDPLIFFTAIVPHGLIEIPLSVIATAAFLRLGAVVTRPPADSTVGHALTVAVGDTLKITMGLLLPALILAAAIEAFITPALVARVLG